MAQQGLVLEYASTKLRADREFILAAVAQNYWVLKHASAELKADREVVLAAVAQGGQTLEYASEDLQDDPLLKNLAALSKNPSKLEEEMNDFFRGSKSEESGLAVAYKEKCTNFLGRTSLSEVSLDYIERLRTSVSTVNLISILQDIRSESQKSSVERKCVRLLSCIEEKFPVVFLEAKFSDLMIAALTTAQKRLAVAKLLHDRLGESSPASRICDLMPSFFPSTGVAVTASQPVATAPEPEPRVDSTP